MLGCSEPPPPPGEPVTLPRLVVENGDSFPEHAARIRKLESRRLRTAVEVLGLREPGEPIHLVLAGEDSPAARATPRWIAGYAFGDQGVAVLFPERTPSYPDSTLEELVLHEVGHVLVARAAGGRPLPRWFNEGLALFIGRPWRLEDRSRVTWALVSGRKVSLADLEEYFSRSRATAGHAYALAGAFVHDLLRRSARDTVAAILSAVASGASFEDAFQAATGVSLQQAEVSFWRRQTLWYRWVPVLTSSVTLWIGITFLALLAIHRRRARDAALRELWQEEERLMTEPDQPPPE